ncbi:putative conjugal transfer protein TraF [Gemmatimonadetes bacterium T265]|nr:putative conjugal transfer protein TraF [Gemmatimonadetes bacterium T265]
MGAVPGRPDPVTGRRRMWRDLGALAVALAIVFGAAALWYRSGLLVNHSASMPVGIYRVARLTASERRAVAQGRLVPPRGAVVVWCLPADVGAVARRRGYVMRGSCPGGAEPVLKRVAAVPGDTVVVDASGLHVNGRLLANSRALARDAAGRAAPAVTPGRIVVHVGMAWLWSPYSMRSYDSRYFGAVPTDGWVGLTYPVWVGETGRETGPAVSRNPSR